MNGFSRSVSNLQTEQILLFAPLELIFALKKYFGKFSKTSFGEDDNGNVFKNDNNLVVI